MWRKSLKVMKKKSGMTTTQIAEGSGIPEPTLEKLFSGQTKDPKLPTMLKLVHFLGYTLDDLETENPIKKAPAPSEDSAEAKYEKPDVESVLVSLGFIQDGQHISDRDLRFINGILDLIDAWFENSDEER